MDHKLLPFALQDVPRYTSYPTAVQFQDGFPADLADQWLAELQPADSLSVYVHVPFCQQLCWYCGCHTSVPNSYRRASTYVDSLIGDITRSGTIRGARKGNVQHLHFGGGTPTYLSNADLGRILAASMEVSVWRRVRRLRLSQTPAASRQTGPSGANGWQRAPNGETGSSP